MIELLQAAEEEFLDAVSRYEDQQDGLGDRFLSEVEQASNRIADWPGIGPVWTYSEVPEGVRRLSVQRFLRIDAWHGLEEPSRVLAQEDSVKGR